MSIKEKLKSLPKDPGVYLMKNDSGSILYVGKAKSLKSRVSSYFQESADHPHKVRKLVQRIADFDIIIVATEVEALLLERTLIKSHAPQFNIMLRDDKQYPYLRIDREADWPRVRKVRNRKDDGAQYLGPFGKVGDLNLVLQTMFRIFPLVRCSEHEFKNARRPCNYYHMKQCLGPCTLPVERSAYLDILDDALDFLRGKNKEVKQKIIAKMEKAAKAEDFETAVLFRDQLRALEKVAEGQSVVVDSVAEGDFIGLASNDTHISFHLLMVRDGKIVGHQNYISEFNLDDSSSALESFILLFYENRHRPKEVFLSIPVPDKQTLEQVLIEDGKRVKILTPGRGDKKKLLQSACQTATYNLSEMQRKGQDTQMALEKLQKLMGTDKLPHRIECMDISNMGGTAVVASNVCFLDGRPAKQNYRLFNLANEQESPDDFEAMRQAVYRRIRGGLEKDDLPDLLIVDGGKGQYSAAADAMERFEDKLPVLFSIAKSRLKDSENNSRSEERLFLDQHTPPLPLPIGSPLYRLVTQLRDEAHRFAINQHRRKRKQLRQRPLLERVPGIGPSLRRKLLEQFGTIEDIASAPILELIEVKGISEAKAEELKDFLKKELKPTKETG